MERQDEERQDVDRMMRRAQQLGHDPERVARAVNHRPPATVEAQPVMDVGRRSWFGARAARRIARR